MVIHLDVYGDPGPVVGFAPLEPGANEDVVVDIDVSRASPALIAMLHEDTGAIGDYEFPDADPPVMVDGEMIIQSFAVSGLAAATEEAMPVDLVEVTIQGFNFEPGDVTIPIGTTVRWTNMGSGNHTVTADDGSFASNTLSNGGTFEFTFNNPGTYLYYCEFHGGPGGEGMSAVVTVTE
jgi:plastocyanin